MVSSIPFWYPLATQDLLSRTVSIPPQVGIIMVIGSIKKSFYIMICTDLYHFHDFVFSRGPTFGSHLVQVWDCQL